MIDDDETYGCARARYPALFFRFRKAPHRIYRRLEDYSSPEVTNTFVHEDQRTGRLAMLGPKKVFGRNEFQKVMEWMGGWLFWSTSILMVPMDGAENDR